MLSNNAIFSGFEVLILVVVEDSLGVSQQNRQSHYSSIVLILVVVEDSLGELSRRATCGIREVLILVVVEDSLGEGGDA